MKHWLLFVVVFFVVVSNVSAQQQTLRGVVVNRFTEEAVPFATLHIGKGKLHLTADAEGKFEMMVLADSLLELQVSAAGYQTKKLLAPFRKSFFEIHLDPVDRQMDEIVVSGTLRTINRSSSPIPVESFPARFFKRTTNTNLFEALSMVNGVQPQITCNVCNTGSIQINGLDGPYTMVLIDGMPIVSSLSSVYGFMGIPNSIIKRVEVVKGPASTLYGNEAVAGLINIITKDPAAKNQLGAANTTSTYGEVNTDVTANLSFKKASTLIGVNHFSFNQKWDVNNDNFTDVTLQNRISVFNKWNFKRKENLPASLAWRYVYEDRWGGELQWNKSFRGGDKIYGESIYTNRLEVLGNFGLKIGKEKLLAEYSYNYHHQDSYYGPVFYLAKQHVAFAQLRWNKQVKNHYLLIGIPFRYNWYDDKTTATELPNGNNNPAVNKNIGLFAQDEWKLSNKLTVLGGLRYEYNNFQGAILAPRLSVKYSAAENQTFRFTAGNGYRVVNLFTEDHAALTGARTVVIKNELRPERSWNANLNWASHYHVGKGLLSADVNGFYTHFTNRIIADYFTDANLIIYDNLNGYAVSKGVSATVDYNNSNGLRINAGATLMDVYFVNGNKEKQKQVFAPGFTANYGIGYNIKPWRFTIDFTGRTQGPMRLPILPNDYRPEYSPMYSLLNLQFTKKIKEHFELMVGVQNLLNFLPQDPIMRPFDPFDKNINDAVSNPFGYTFDPSYNYAPMMKRRGVVGVRVNID
jgi:outer membrane receptor for ferrienterochelin and colicins